jgi:hypothetical protein
MTSYNIPTKYKAYLGRIFILRKHKVIQVSLDKKAGKRFACESIKTFGKAVYVFDESNSKVQVTTLSGATLWISKYYLLKEVETTNLNDSKNKINELCSELIKCNLSDNSKMTITQILKNLLQ